MPSPYLSMRFMRDNPTAADVTDTDPIAAIKEALSLAIRNTNSRLYFCDASDKGDTDRATLKAENAVYMAGMEALLCLRASH